MPKVKLETDPLKDITPQKVKSALKSSIEAGVQFFLKSVKGGFDQQKTPGGSNWQPLSPAYEKFKQKAAPGKNILEFSGQMKSAALSPQIEIAAPQSSDSSDSKDTVALEATLTVNNKEAQYMEFGSGRSPVRSFFTLEGDLPGKLVEGAGETFGKALGFD